MAKRGRWWPTSFYGGASNSTVFGKFWWRSFDGNETKSGFFGVLAYGSKTKGSENLKNGSKLLQGQNGGS